MTDDRSSLRQEFEGGSSGSRLEVDGDVTDSDNEIVHGIVNARKDISNGDLSPIVGAREIPLSAFLATLERDEFERERKDLGQRLVESLGRNPDRYDDFPKSDLIRLMHEAALDQVAPDVSDLISQASDDYDEWREGGSTGLG